MVVVVSEGWECVAEVVKACSFEGLYRRGEGSLIAVARRGAVRVDSAWLAVSVGLWYCRCLNVAGSVKRGFDAFLLALRQRVQIYGVGRAIFELVLPWWLAAVAIAMSKMSKMLEVVIADKQ